MRRQHGVLYPWLVIAAISVVIFSAWSLVSLFSLFPSAHSSAERPTIAFANGHR